MDAFTVNFLSGCIASLLANNADRSVMNAVRRLSARDVPENHDVLKALHVSFLGALRQIEKACYAAGANAQDNMSSRALTDLLKNKSLIKLDMATPQIPAEALNAQIDLAQSTCHAEGAGTAATNAVIAVLQEKSNGGLSPRHIDVFHLGFGEYLPWSEYYDLFWAEQIKTDDRMQRFMVESRLKEILNRLENNPNLQSEINRTLSEVNGKLAALSQEVRQSREENKAGFDTTHALIKRDKIELTLEELSRKDADPALIEQFDRIIRIAKERNIDISRERAAGIAETAVRMGRSSRPGDNEIAKLIDQGNYRSAAKRKAELAASRIEESLKQEAAEFRDAATLALPFSLSEAKQYLSASLKLDPINIENLLTYAELQHDLSSTKEAMLTLKKIRTLGPTTAEAIQANIREYYIRTRSLDQAGVKSLLYDNVSLLEEARTQLDDDDFVWLEYKTLFTLVLNERKSIERLGAFVVVDRLKGNLDKLKGLVAPQEETYLHLRLNHLELDFAKDLSVPAAFRYHDEALSAAPNFTDPNLSISVYSTIATLFGRLRDRIAKMDPNSSSIKASELDEKLDDLSESFSAYVGRLADQANRYGILERISLTFNEIGVSYWGSGQVDAAENQFAKSILNSRNLVNLYPESANIAENHIVGLNWLGILLSGQNRTQEALTYFNEALDLCQQFTRKDDVVEFLLDTQHSVLGWIVDCLGRQIRQRLAKKQNKIAIGLVEEKLRRLDQMSGMRPHSRALLRIQEDSDKLLKDLTRGSFNH